MSKLQVEIKVRVNGEERWADADKLFKYLYPDKVDIKGKMPDPYPVKVEAFFNSIDKKLLDAWISSYPNVNVNQELKMIKAWLLSNTHKAKSHFKTFVNNWLARAMLKGGSSSAKESTQAEWDKYR